MRRIFGLLVLLSMMGAAGAQTQTLYRCVPKGGGPVSFQSEPCDANSRTASATPYTPEREPTYAEKAAREAAGRRESAYLSSLAGTGAYRRPQAQGASISMHGGSKCEDAKRTRDQALERVGLSRSIDGLRAWDEYVYEQCK